MTVFNFLFLPCRLSIFPPGILPGIFFFALVSLSSLNAYAIQLPEQGFSISHNSYNDGDVSMSGPLFMARKTLSEDSLSLKVLYQGLELEDDSTEQLDNLPTYSESQTSFGAGIDYLYFDSSLSFSSNYGIQDTNKQFDINMDVAQEFNNANRTLLMGYSHKWNDDSDLGMHNKTQIIRFAYKSVRSEKWALLSNLDFASSEGDLEDFLTARRFQLPDRTTLPKSKTEKLLQLTSINELKRNNSIRSSIALTQNDWDQDGKTFSINYFQERSETFTMIYSARYVSRAESRYFLESIITPAQDFYSDHRTLAKQNFKELGIAGQWELKKRPGKRLDDFKIDLGFSLIKSDYSTLSSVSNTGQLLHLNFSSTF